jgi:hypothetical protein
VKLQVHTSPTACTLGLSLLLSLASLASAQQPTVTPPAEAATWDVASASLIAILASHGHNYVIAWNPTEQYRVSLEKDFDTPMRCDLGGTAFYFENLHGTAKAGLFTLDFTRIDPLSIQVAYDNTLEVWAATMSGLRGMAIGSWKGVVRSHVAIEDVKGSVKPNLLEPACSPREKHCKPDDGTSTSADQLFDDQQTAEKFVVAARRAAYACSSGR